MKLAPALRNRGNIRRPVGIVQVPMTSTTFLHSVPRTERTPSQSTLPSVSQADARVDDDTLLVARARKGDVAAFEQLYRSTIPRVFALCLRMTADEQRARELAHDAFVKAWESLDSYRGEAGFQSWMHRLTVNVVLQDVRSTRRREARVHLSDDDQSPVDAPHDDQQMDLATRLELQEALARLTPDARRVVVLHDIAGYRHDEIAALLGVASGTVRARLHHARKQLREWMTP
jgi:RNA polymerase sigma factor (sigma-70 family)